MSDQEELERFLASNPTLLSDPELVPMVLGQGAVLVEPITPEAVDALCARWDIDSNGKVVLTDGLRFAAHRYATQMQVPPSVLPGVRKELTALMAGGARGLAALQGLSEAARHVLHRAGLGLKLLGQAHPRLLQDSAGRLILECPRSGQRDLADLAEWQPEVGQAAEAALTFARKGKLGRPTDDAMRDVMCCCYVFWVDELGRRFTLDWTQAPEPITDAARFCVDFARRVDPDVTVSRVQTSSLAARDLLRDLDRAKIRAELLSN